MNSGTVVFTTSAYEFNQLLNEANNYSLSKQIIEALKSEVQDLKQHLVFIGKEVYEADGKYNVWSAASDKPEVNDALNYAKSLADRV